MDKQKEYLSAISLAKKILSKDELKLFNSDYFYDEIFYEFYNSNNAVKITSMFELVGGSIKKYKYKTICCKCNESNIKESSKSAFFRYLSEQKHGKYLCKKCHKKEYEQYNDKEWKEILETNTKYFIDEYLVIGQHFIYKSKSLFWDLHNLSVNKDVIKNHILNMNYKDFLATPYWDIISWYVKALADFKCSLCNKSNTRLMTHHSTYDHHGEEIYYYKTDLICLCGECHAKFHDKEVIEKDIKMFVIIETDTMGEIPENEDERCYLNHAYLHSFSFGSLDMAWNTESHLEAEGMLSRAPHASRNCKIIEI